MNLSAIEALYYNLVNSIFTSDPPFGYNDLATQFTLFANGIKNYEGDNDEWFRGGKSTECGLGDLISGAYWHYAESHTGEGSHSHAALCVLGQIYAPETECMPEDDDISNRANCYRRLAQLAKTQ